jgi:hypothetical protein
MTQRTLFSSDPEERWFMNVIRKEDFLWSVGSETDEEDRYIVRQVDDDGTLICNCPHFMNRDVSTCKHIKRVATVREVGGYDDQREADPTPAPVQFHQDLVEVREALSCLTDTVEEMIEKLAPYTF